MIIKSKNLWEQSIERFVKAIGHYPSTPEDIATVTYIYRKAGGSITIKKEDTLYKVLNTKSESLKNELKGFLSKWIKNPIVLGIALYFMGHYLGKFISKNK